MNTGGLFLGGGFGGRGCGLGGGCSGFAGSGCRGGRGSAIGGDFGLGFFDLDLFAVTDFDDAKDGALAFGPFVGVFEEDDAFAATEDVAVTGEGGLAFEAAIEGHCGSPCFWFNRARKYTERGEG